MSAPTLNFDTVNSSDGLSFGFKDTTGVYDATVNPGGFNSPNWTVAQVTAASIAIYLADGSIKTFNGSSTPVFGPGGTPAFPNTSGSVFKITNVMLGMAATTVIQDWISYITYSCIGPGAAVTTTSLYKFISQNSLCCVNKMEAAVDFSSNCAPCDNKALQSYLKAQTMYNAIYNALSCSTPMPNKASLILQGLTDLCTQSGSSCGCS